MTAHTMPLIATITVEIRGGIPRGGDLDEEWLQLVADGLQAQAESDVLGEGIDRASVTCTLSTDVEGEPQPEPIADPALEGWEPNGDGFKRGKLFVYPTKNGGPHSADKPWSAGATLTRWPPLYGLHKDPDAAKRAAHGRVRPDGTGEDTMKTQDGWNREPPEPGNRVLLIRFFHPDGGGRRGIAYHNGALWVLRWDDEEDDGGEYEQSWWPEHTGWAFAEDCGPKLEEKTAPKAEAPSLKPSQWVKAQGHGWTLLVEGAPVVQLVPLDEFWKLKTVGDWRALVAPYGSWGGAIAQAQLWGRGRGVHVPPLAELVTSSPADEALEGWDDDGHDGHKKGDLFVWLLPRGDGRRSEAKPWAATSTAVAGWRTSEPIYWCHASKEDAMRAAWGQWTQLFGPESLPGRKATVDLDREGQAFLEVFDAANPVRPKQPPTLADVAAALRACAAVLVASQVAKYTTFYDDGSAAVTLSGDGAPALQAAGATWSRWYDVDAGGQRRHLMADVDGVSFSVFESRTATDVEGDTQPGHKATKETR